MVPNLEFRYFRTAGVPQTIHLLVQYGGLELDDVRREIGKLFGTEKSGAARLSDGAFVESVAAARYVAKKVELTGSDHWENLEIDAVVDTIGDLLMKIQMYTGEQNLGRKQVLKDKLFDEVVPFYFGRLDEIAADNKGHLALGKLTWVDFYFAALEHVFGSVVDQNVLDKYPNLKAVVENVSGVVPLTPQV